MNYAGVLCMQINAHCICCWPSYNGNYVRAMCTIGTQLGTHIGCLFTRFVVLLCRCVCKLDL